MRQRHRPLTIPSPSPFWFAAVPQPNPAAHFHNVNLGSRKTSQCSSRGDAAILNQPENLLLTTITNPITIDVHVQAVRVSALVDTGATILVMSSNLRRNLQKVMAPAVCSTLRVADEGTTTVAGMCTARVEIAGRDI